MTDRLEQMDVTALGLLLFDSDRWWGTGDFRFPTLKERNEFTTSLFWLRDRGLVESRPWDPDNYPPDPGWTCRNCGRHDERECPECGLHRWEDPCYCSLLPGVHTHRDSHFEWRITEAGRVALAAAEAP